jgi:hypothetical protein
MEREIGYNYLNTTFTGASTGALHAASLLLGGYVDLGVAASLQQTELTTYFPIASGN